MPMLPKKTLKAVPSVNAATAGDGLIPVTLQLPKFKKLTQAQIEARETEEGKDALAICDVTGEPIFNETNINVINNDGRPELHGKVISTKVLRMLFEGAGNALPKTEKAKAKAK